MCSGSPATSTRLPRLQRRQHWKSNRHDRVHPLVPTDNRLPNSADTDIFLVTSLRDRPSKPTAAVEVNAHLDAIPVLPCRTRAPVLQDKHSPTTASPTTSLKMALRITPSRATTPKPRFKLLLVRSLTSSPAYLSRTFYSRTAPNIMFQCTRHVSRNYEKK